ncbi:hypothetical protein O181_088881 [Austropuccinia psidii MF-1]|uniref:Uncharacterized protein n=1 Tax=Austropuccinia psidii MF-1 TaxID=1389203 RepID=A0A9Q3ISI0_9BASI|nr:hypothetical protein [Austropuccinia psidii MF-1]
MEPGKEYSDSFRIERSGKPTHLPSGFTPNIIQKISGQESPFSTIPRIFQDKTRIKRKKENFHPPEEERTRPNDQEAVQLSEGSTKEQGIFVNNPDKIRRPAISNEISTENEKK